MCSKAGRNRKSLPGGEEVGEAGPLMTAHACLGLGEGQVEGVGASVRRRKAGAALGTRPRTRSRRVGDHQPARARRGFGLAPGRAGWW